MPRDFTPLYHASTCLLSPFVLAAGTLLSSGTAHAEPADWNIDPEHFSIAFDVTHAGYQQQLGLFLDGAGSFRYDPDNQTLTGGRVEIQAASIFTDHEDRDDHLTSRDFLNARRHPVIVFEADGFVPGDQTDALQGTVTGNLTLLGQTHPVELEVRINKHADYPFGHGQETLGISAQTTISRSQWGMDYGVADNLVGDDVSLRFELEAIRQ